ncbi:ABC transporter ATP-binding protein [Acetobacteraceae bacterium H6797]|nr:ABC transporter ATP-binding protein [Acetobacteraceae bacterium H6797]
MPHLDLDQLTKTYDGNLAVDRLCLPVEKGECIALLGPSGCGKTTTLRMVAGFITPDSGHIRLDGRAIERDPPHKRKIGMVFQAYALFPHLSAAGNVAFGLEMQGVTRAERDRRVADALAMVGLAGMAERYPAQLSGGQQQRVALARALVIEPDLLLLDEPLSNLDATLRGEMRAEIARLRARIPITTLFVTHDQGEAMALADRIAVLDRGKLIECADPRSLSEQPTRLFTAQFLGERSVLPGRLENGFFDAGHGIRLAPGPGAPERPSHLVLRAARLGLAPAGSTPATPFAAAGTIAEAAWLGDSISYEVSVGGLLLRVIRPTTEPAFVPGQPVMVTGGPEALSWLDDFAAV